MNKDHVELGLFKRERHRLEVFPVVFAQLVMGLPVTFLQILGGSGAPILEEPQFMVAEQRQGPAFAGEVDDFAAIGTAIDEVSEQDETVVLGEFEASKQLGEFEVAAMDVSDGDKSPVHTAEKC